MSPPSSRTIPPSSANKPRNGKSRARTAWQPHGGRWRRLPKPPPAAASRHGEIWSEQDERVLARYYTTHGGFYTAALLGRSVLATRNRAGKLGIPGYETLQWEERELRWAYRELVRAPFGSDPVAAIARELGRTRSSVVSKLLQSGEELPLPWRARERAFLREHYATMPVRELAQALGRAHDAVTIVAAWLGTQRHLKRRAWTKREDARLVKMYRRVSIAEIARAMNRPHDDVADRLRELEVPLVSHRAWKPWEIRVVREGFGRRPVAEIAAELGRTVGAVQMQATTLDLRRRQTRQLWTAREDAMLRKHYRTSDARELARRMGRPAGSLHNRARRLGIARQSMRSWTAAELRLVRKLYRTHSLAEMGEKLGRTQRSVESAVRRLGLVEQEGKHRRWTAAEDRQVRKLSGKLSYEEIAERLGRTPGAVRARVLVVG